MRKCKCKNMKKIRVENKGITLVALVITIIVLIMLAGISISMLLGDEGIVEKAKMGATNYQNASEFEQTYLSTLMNTVTEAITVPEKIKNPKVTLLDGTEVYITKDNIASYIGTYVQYDCTYGGTWQIFFLDTENKFKDGKNTLYLKRVYDNTKIWADASYEDYTESKSQQWMEKLNPLWKQIDGQIDNKNEKKASYLCFARNWDNYYNPEVAEYAIGSPSIEMYMDAYNQWGGYEEGKGPLSYDYKIDGYGYDVGVNGDYFIKGTMQRDNTLKSGTNDVFYTLHNYWWIASPGHRYDDKGPVVIDGSAKKVNSLYNWTTICYCPVVALK